MSYITEDEFNKHLINIRQAAICPVDTEGTLSHPFSQTWGLSTSANTVPEYFGFNHLVGSNLPNSWLPRLAAVISDHPCLVFHNAKHDLRALRNLGINYTGKFYDTMLMAHMNDENIFSKELDYLSRLYGGDPKRKPDEMDLIIKAFGWEYIPLTYIRPYGANDAYITGELFRKLLPSFQEQGFDGPLWDVEQKFVRLMMKIEDNGIPIDVELSEREYARGLGIMNEIQSNLGFNPGSTTQLGHFLLDEMNLEPFYKKTKKGKHSFDKEAMQYYDELLQFANDDRAKQILTYRGWQKTTSSNYKRYLEGLDLDGRLRCNYKLHGTHTSRLSCENPNLQQIPRESTNDWNGHLKRAFITDPEFTAYEADFNQLELRVGAAYGKVRRLLDIFDDPARDIFEEMSTDLRMSRNNTKTLNYTLQFGGGARRISNVFGVSEPAARSIIRNYFSNYEGLAKATALAKFRAEQNGFVNYWTGRRRHFSDSEETRKAFNSVCQGGAFEIVKRRMLACDDAGLNNKECRMDLQVHDSVRFEIANGKEDIYLPEIRRTLEDVASDFKFGVKFRVKINEWGTKNEYRRDLDAAGV